MALATRSTPAEWDRLLDEDPRIIATVIDVMREQQGGSGHG